MPDLSLFPTSETHTIRHMDKEIVLIAVKTCAEALSYASNKIQKNIHSIRGS